MEWFNLRGKVAVVTGGNGGIGLGMARGLVRAGATVVVVGRNEAKSERAVAELGSVAGSHAGASEWAGPPVAVRADVTDAHSIQEMVEEVVRSLGGIHILVNNAGTNIRKRPEELSEAQWHQVMDANVTSAFLASKAVYPHLKAAGGGKVLNNGSMLSLFGTPWGSAYATSKGGMVQLTKSLATAWAADNIQVNCFLPGWINTDLTIRAREEVPGLHERVLARTPAGRWGDTDDFEGIAVFLASTASDFITGTSIAVDGGYSVMG